MIPLFKVHLPFSVDAPLLETLHSGFIGQGPKVEEFEKLIGAFIGNEYALTVNSGTSALQLALKLANIGYGDEVITTPMTCSATCMPILMAGAKIVWADIDPWTACINPESVRKKFTAKTKAVICVDWGGYPCDLSELMTLCHEHGVKLIEDAAHAFGARYQGKRVGSISDFTCFSFQAIKQLTTIDGGACACADADAYKRGKLLRWYGIDREQKRGDFRCEADIVEAGTKWHMNDVAATIGIEQMKYLPSILSQHQDNALYYDDELKRAGIQTVQPLRYKYDRFSTHWLYTVRAHSRDRFVKWMNDNGIQTSRVHQRNDIHTYAREFKTDLPGVDEFNAHQCSIPVGWWLTFDDKAYILNKIKEWENVCL